MYRAVVETSEVINRETGEVKVSSKTTRAKQPTEPSFVKMYIDDISNLNSLSHAQSKVLMSLAKRADYDNEVVVTVRLQREIMSEANIKSLQTVRNCINELKKVNIIASVDRGIYMLNPSYFAKGKWKDMAGKRDKYVKISITYTDEGRTVESIIGDV